MLSPRISGRGNSAQRMAVCFVQNSTEYGGNRVRLQVITRLASSGQPTALGTSAHGPRHGQPPKTHTAPCHIDGPPTPRVLRCATPETAPD